MDMEHGHMDKEDGHMDRRTGSTATWTASTVWYNLESSYKLKHGQTHRQGWEQT